MQMSFDLSHSFLMTTPTFSGDICYRFDVVTQLELS